MNLFSEDLILTKYTDPNDILLDYFDLRLEYYDKRKDYLIKILKRQLKILENKARFISEYISGKLDINKKAKSVIEQLLEDRKYAKFGDVGNVEGSGGEGTDGERSDVEGTGVERSEGSFDYLTRMPIISMSLEKVNELENACKEKRKELDTLSAKTDRDLWRDDLSELQTKLN
jgi:DNA topoisomerase-2